MMIGFLGIACLMPTQAITEENALVAQKTLGLELAADLAEAILQGCRDADFQVVVGDRFGTLQVLLRDHLAGPHTPDTARRKAWTSVGFRTDTQNLAELTASGSRQSVARDITDALMLGGGVSVEAAGSIVGGVGVSGAPGGDEDDRCARAGIESIINRLEF